MHVVGACKGDPHDPLTNSGKSKALFDALERRAERFTRVDVRLRGAGRAVAAGASWRPGSPWQRRFSSHPATLALQTRRCGRVIRRDAAGADVVVQVNGLFRTPVDAPYVVYTDTTFTEVRRTWPGQVPFGRWEAAAILRHERLLFTRAAHVFTMGRSAAEAIVADYGIPESRVSVVGAGANLTGTSPGPGDRPFRPAVLFVGREFVRKGGEVLLEAFDAVRRRVPGATLTIVGCRPDVAAAGVEVIGPVGDRARLGALYAAAEVFCMPSLAEPYGLALVEAMGHGLPCVGTTVGAMPEIVRAGETGVLVPPGDPVALADALGGLLGDPATARAMGAAGRRRVECELSWDAVVDRMWPVLADVAGRRG